MTASSPSEYSLDRLQARAAAERPGVVRYVGWALVLGLLAWSWQGAEIRPFDLLRDSGNMGQFARDFFPPDFHDWRLYAREMVVTVHIAIWGTLLAVLAAVPMGLLCASNVTPMWLHQPVRRIMDACRAINEMVFAMLFIVAVGLGPFAGVLALAVHTTGTLAKLFSEAVEAIDPRPVEGIRATGARRLPEIIFGVIPQVMPLWSSLVLYRLETNIRSATTLGIVGAGGIGQTLYESIRAFQYAETAAQMLIIAATVMIVDLLSARLRKALV